MTCFPLTTLVMRATVLNGRVRWAAVNVVELTIRRDPPMEISAIPRRDAAFSHAEIQIGSPFVQGDTAAAKLVDPYSYRARYNMPKLLLLGTKDPYWTVDALRHYWDDLPELKFLFQTSNGGHNISKGAAEALAAFFQRLRITGTLEMEWQLMHSDQGLLRVKVNRPAKAIHVWTRIPPHATSAKRSAELSHFGYQTGQQPSFCGDGQAGKWCRAFIGDVVLTSSTGHGVQALDPGTGSAV